MDKEHMVALYEVLKEINATVLKIKEDPFSVTASDLDILDYNLGIMGDYLKNARQG